MFCSDNSYISILLYRVRFHKPCETTFEISVPSSWAMKPSTENIAKPAYILVAEFAMDKQMPSLWKEHIETYCLISDLILFINIIIKA